MARARTEGEPALGLESSPIELDGVGPARAAALARLGLESLRDLLLYAPRRIESSGQVVDCERARQSVGETVVVRGSVERRSFQRFGRRSTLRIEFVDESGSIEVCYFNQPWMRERLLLKDELVLAGRVVETKRGPALVSPRVVDDESEAGRWIPVYATTDGLGQELLRGLCRRVCETLAEALDEPLPESELERLELPRQADAVRELHAPSSPERFVAARCRVMLEELLGLQARVMVRARRRTGRARVVGIDEAAWRELTRSFPFELTDGQDRICGELRADLARAAPMRRLIQGDVGSGKTALGLVACLAVARAGAQAAFMAPTELLAEQHHAGMRPLLEGLGLRACTLTGSLRARERRSALEAIEAGTVDLVFGTHALFSDGVRFRELALAVIDEQHRFGVAQRAALLDKGRDVHLLLMTATPIPRTLALTIYGDLEVSVLREKPPGRGELRTRWLRGKDRARVLPFLAERLSAGEQVYWVAPRIGEPEEGEDLPPGALRAFERLSSSELADHGVQLVHGRLDASERGQRLDRFRRGEARLLVSTTLIEVGVNVPAATVMVIEEAERFGLAQLHQLRGRVGRSARASWCLLYGRSGARERLELLERTNDGFEIAEEDLRRRGMGELLGLRQSGESAFETAAESGGELDLLLAARDLLAADPALARHYAARHAGGGAPHVP